METVKPDLARKERWVDMLGAAGPTQLALISLFFLFSCLVLPLCDSFTVSAIYLVCCAVFYFYLTRAFLPLLYYAVPAGILYLGSVFLPTVPNTLLLPTALLSIVAGAGTGAYLLIQSQKPRYLLCLMPLLSVLAGVGAGALTGDPLRGLLSLLPAAVGAVCGLCAWLNVRRTPATLILSATLAAALVLAGVITLGAVGKLTQSPLSLVTDHVRAAITWLLAQAQGVYAEAGLELVLSEIEVSNVATLLVNILPGLYLAACSIAAFLIWRTMLQLLLALGKLPRLPIQLTALTVSRFCAVLYIVVAVLSYFSGTGNATLFGAVCQNLSIVFTPVLALIGFASLFARGAQRGCLNYLLMGTFVLALVSAPTTAISLLALFGAAHILLAGRLTPPDQKGEN